MPVPPDTATPAGVLPAEVLNLRAALDALLDVDPRDLAGSDTVIALERELARTEAVLCRQADAFDTREEWRATTAQNSPAWIATHTHIPKHRAAQRRRIGRALHTMHHVHDAFTAGRITIDHVTLLVAAHNRSRHTAYAFMRDETMLVDWATTHTYPTFKRCLDEWLLWADEDAADDHAARQRDLRSFNLSQSIDNLWFGDLVLDPVNGEILNNALRTITDELFATDHTTATDLLGHTPTGDDLARLTRTPTQRRLDALVEMARRATATPTGSRAPQPLFTVLVGHETLTRVCELASGTIIAPAALTPWLEPSIIERIIFDAPDRVLSVSRRRTFTGALRRAIEVRDRRCSDKYCDLPAHRCQIDHLTPHAHGGETSQQNGDTKCDFHNRRRDPQRNRPKNPRRPRRPETGLKDRTDGPSEDTDGGPDRAE